jgi:hypothetical protein
MANEQAPKNSAGRESLWDSMFRAADLMDAAASKSTTLLPGERRAANGVIIGSGAARDIPRFGSDQNDSDYPADSDD